MRLLPTLLLLTALLCAAQPTHGIPGAPARPTAPAAPPHETQKPTPTPAPSDEQAETEPDAETDAETPPPNTPAASLADASPNESEALNRLAASASWTSRALAVMRLERYDCTASAGRLVSMTSDSSWRVRAYAFAVLARRGVEIPEATLLGERDERVLRTILRGRYRLPQESIDTRISAIERSSQPMRAMVALEVLAALDHASDQPEHRELRKRMDELLARVILRMTRTEAGALSPRLAAITTGDDSGRDYRWREWYRTSQRRPGFRPAALVPTVPAGTRLVPPNKIASLDAEAFIAFEGYLASIADRPMDLALLIDCTASMWRELAEAQSSADDLVEFLGSVTGGVRVAVIGYRDRTDAWEMKAWDFTQSVDEARTRLWALSAEGGGDDPESVYAAMKTAFGKLNWLAEPAPPAPQPIRAIVLIGDAPPHVGERTLCIDLARRGFAKGVRTHGIVAREHELNLEDEGGKVAERPQQDGAPTPREARDGNGDGGRDGGGVTKRDPADTRKPRADRSRQPAGRSRPPIDVARRESHTGFPEIAKAGGGRAVVIKDDASLVAQIAELTVADKYRAEFGDFFAAFRLLCR